MATHDEHNETLQPLDQLSSEALACIEHLRASRLRANLTLDDISSRTKIPLRMLEAIERCELSRLPGGIYARSYIRSYAAEVKADPDAAVAALMPELPAAGEVTADVVERPPVAPPIDFPTEATGLKRFFKRRTANAELEDTPEAEVANEAPADLAPMLPSGVTPLWAQARTAVVFLVIALVAGGVFAVGRWAWRSPDREQGATTAVASAAPASARPVSARPNASAAESTRAAAVSRVDAPPITDTPVGTAGATRVGTGGNTREPLPPTGQAVARDIPLPAPAAEGTPAVASTESTVENSASTTRRRPTRVANGGANPLRPMGKAVGSVGRGFKKLFGSGGRDARDSRRNTRRGSEITARPAAR